MVCALHGNVVIMNYYIPGFDVIYYPLKNGRRYGVFGAFIEEAQVNLEKTITIRQFAYVKKVGCRNGKLYTFFNKF